MGDAERRLTRFLSDLVERRLAFLYNIEISGYGRDLLVHLQFHHRGINPMERAGRTFRLTQHELYMGGITAVVEFEGVIYRDCLVSCSRQGWPNHGIYEGIGRADPAEYEAMRRAMVRASEMVVNPPVMFVDRPWGWDTLGLHEHDHAAEKRARALFKMVAGKEAHDRLNSGKPIPITGSLGTAYTLHNRATYCVESADGRMRFCVVVPGVPLWDHLLGVKITVENDEPLFLQTANVANNAPHWVDQRDHQAFVYEAGAGLRPVVQSDLAPPLQTRERPGIRPQRMTATEIMERMNQRARSLHRPDRDSLINQLIGGDSE